MKRGDTVKFKGNKGPLFAGKKAIIRRVSRRTAGLTLELLEDVTTAYCKGREVHVAQYEVEPAV